MKLLLILWLLLGLSLSRTQARVIYALGDLHGDLEATISLLQDAKIIDSNKQWMAGDAILVQTGDVLDRGPNGKEIYRLFDRISNSLAFRRAGAEIRMLMGNHEAMNLMGNFKYVSPSELPRNPITGEPDAVALEKRRKEYSEDYGVMSSRLKELEPIAWIDGNVFVHGGIIDEWAKMGISGFRQYVKDRIKAKDWSDELWGPHGPFSTRFYTYNEEVSPTEICKVLERSLDALGSAKRMIVGHTPLRKIWRRCNDRLIAIDTAVSRFDNDGNVDPATTRPGLVRIDGDVITEIYGERRDHANSDINAPEMQKVANKATIMQRFRSKLTGKSGG